MTVADSCSPSGHSLPLEPLQLPSVLLWFVKKKGGAGGMQFVLLAVVCMSSLPGFLIPLKGLFHSLACVKRVIATRDRQMRNKRLSWRKTTVGSSHFPKNLRQAFNSASNIWLLKISPLGKKEFTGQIFAS